MIQLTAADTISNRSAHERVALAKRRAIPGIAILGLALSLLPVGYALYLMLLIDIALPGRSGSTIVGLLTLAAALLVLHTVLLATRHRLFAHLAAAYDQAGGMTERLDPIRKALVGPAVPALIDTACIPVALIVLALVGGPVALVPLAGAIVILLVLAPSAGKLARDRDAARSAYRLRDVEAALGQPRRALLALLGSGQHASATDARHRRQVSSAEQLASWHEGHAVRLVGLTATLFLAATAAAATWLMASDAASHGAFAATMLLATLIFWTLHRLATHLAVLSAARQAWRAFEESVNTIEAPRALVPLPPPVRRLEVSNAALPVHGTRRMMLQEVSFAAQAGDVVAVIGPANCGKSVLLRMLAGQVRAVAGTVRLDGATLDQWDDDARSAHIGYLPTVPELMPGTVAANIARFDPAADPALVTRAALAAGAHDAIVRLPNGYDTELAQHDAPAPALSVQHRIALARALYGDPFLLLLDNPSAFQDGEGNAALRRCLAGVQERGGIAIAVGDSAAIIDSANLVLVLRKGGMADFGTKEDVRARMAERQRRDAERLAQTSVYAEPRVADPVVGDRE